VTGGRARKRGGGGVGTARCVVLLLLSNAPSTRVSIVPFCERLRRFSDPQPGTCPAAARLPAARRGAAPRKPPPASAGIARERVQLRGRWKVPGRCSRCGPLCSRQEAERPPEGRRRTRRARGGTRRSTAGGRAARRRGAEACRRPASSRARRRRRSTSARTAGRRPVAAAERSGERTERVRLVHVSRSSDQKLHDLQMVCRLFFAAAWKSGVFHRPSRAASLSTSAR
jgi:hypothetical protein